MLKINQKNLEKEIKNIYFQVLIQLQEVAKMELQFITEQKKIIQEFKTEISSLENLNRELLEPIVNNLIKKHETNFKGVGQPLRVILTGSRFGPGIYDILTSLGKEEVNQRLGNKIIGQNC